MYKVGDKLICKNSLQVTISNACLNIKDLAFTKGIEYEVFQFDKIYNEVLIGKIGKDRNIYHWFWFGRINDYFYTDIELRKIKLERLNNV